MSRPKKKEEGDENLADAFAFCEKIRQFEQELKKEIAEHPDFKAEPISISDELVYIVLKRTANGVRYLQDVEVEFNARN
jgi:hypothetical protein